MTARCPGNGTSSLKPGAGQENVVAGALITSGLEALGPWTTPLAALIDGFIYQGSTQCTGDPPPMPVWDQNDALTVAIGLLNPNAQATLTKANNLLLNYAWDLWCQCDSGQATAATPSPQPPNTTVTSANPTTPCFEGSWSRVPPQCVGQQFFDSRASDITTALLPTTGAQLTLTDPAGSYIVHGVPAGLQTIYWTYTLPSWSFGSQTAAMSNIVFYDSTGNELSPREHFTENFPANATTYSFHTNLPAGTAYYRWQSFCNSNANIGTATSPDIVYSRVFCGGNQPGQYTNCCPPDPAVQLGIRNILQILQHLELGGTTPPSSWTDGTRHSNLSGHGSFLIGTNTIGLRVETTQLPSEIRQTVGSPTFYYSLGFITPYALQSPLRGWRLVFNPESFMLPEFTDQIGWTLTQDAVIDIVELVPVA